MQSIDFPDKNSCKVFINIFYYHKAKNVCGGDRKKSFFFHLKYLTYDEKICLCSSGKSQGDFHNHYKFINTLNPSLQYACQ